MWTGAVLLFAIVTLLLAVGTSQCAEQRWISLVALCVDAAAGVAVTTSALLLIPGWEAQMEHFDFTEMGRARARRGRSQGLSMLSFYLLPYELALFGGLATCGLAWRLYYRVRYSY
jgi:hypothetical protein